MNLERRIAKAIHDENERLRIGDSKSSDPEPYEMLTKPEEDIMRGFARAVIDELGLCVETQSLRWMDPNGPFPQSRAVGKWEDG